MIVYRREPAVENVMEFAARFATCFQPAPKAEEEEGGEQQQQEDDEEEDEDEEHPFLNFIFNFLLEVKSCFVFRAVFIDTVSVLRAFRIITFFFFKFQSHKVSSHAVRFRACQLINKLLGSMAENAQIDDDLFDRIHQAMLVRVTDKFPNVRIQAALAMTRLQQPNDPDCPTINGL